MKSKLGKIASICLIIISFYGVFLASVAIKGCVNELNEVHYWKISKVESVFMHEKNNYSIAYKLNNEIKFKRIFPSHQNRMPPRNGVRILQDVDLNMPMWAEGEENGIGNIYTDIHIHSINDINGSGWNHGKFGTGTTIKIQ